MANVKTEAALIRPPSDVYPREKRLQLVLAYNLGLDFNVPSERVFSMFEDLIGALIWCVQPLPRGISPHKDVSADFEILRGVDYCLAATKWRKRLRFGNRFS